MVKTQKWCGVTEREIGESRVVLNSPFVYWILLVLAIIFLVDQYERRLRVIWVFIRAKIDYKVTQSANQSNYFHLRIPDTGASPTFHILEKLKCVWRRFPWRVDDSMDCIRILTRSLLHCGWQGCVCCVPASRLCPFNDVRSFGSRWTRPKCKREALKQDGKVFWSHMKENWVASNSQPVQM